MDSKIKKFAYFLPQFYPTPENDRYWGKGFTEWTNVKSAKKLYKTHRQPIKPAKFGYPDEPPKQMIGGYHPDFGDRHSYYNRLDRHSADTMQNAPTQDLKIDMKVQNQTTNQKTLNIINNIRAAKSQYAKAKKKNK